MSTVKRPLGDVRDASEIRLSLRLPVGRVVVRRLLRPGELGAQILLREQHLGRTLVLGLLVQRERKRRQRHDHSRLNDDPFTPASYLEVVP
jgi:hypothetical protein